MKKGTAVNCQHSLYYHDFGLLLFDSLSACKKKKPFDGLAMAVGFEVSADIQLTRGPQETEVPPNHVY